MIGQRGLLLLILGWALVMIVPDFARVVRPLGSFGFYANGNGLIYDVSGPFETKNESPAWKAGMREGDKLDLSRMRCLPFDPDICASTIAAVSGNEYVLPGREGLFELLPNGTDRPREFRLVAEARPSNWLVRLVLMRPGYLFLFFWHVCVASSQCIDFIPVHSAWVYMCDALEAFCFSFAKTGLTLKRSAVVTNTNVDVFRDI